MNCRCYITEILLIWRKTPTNKPDSFYFIFLPNDKILDRSNLKAFAEDEINVTEKLKLFWEGQKTLWKKEKMLVTSIFSFPHSVFKKLLP